MDTSFSVANILRERHKASLIFLVRANKNVSFGNELAKCIVAAASQPTQYV